MANELLGLPSWGFVPHTPCVPLRCWLAPLHLPPQLLRWPPCSCDHSILLSRSFVSVWSGETRWGWKHMPGEVSVHRLLLLLME